MSSFDITSILDFNPAKFACPVCRGLIKGTVYKWSDVPEGKKAPWQYCPICRVDFIDGEYAPENGYANSWLREQGSAINLGSDLFDHARTLASVVRDSRSKYTPWPTMRLLLEVLARARSFVHFASWGISHQWVGVLKLASMRVPVYGFISSADKQIAEELTKFPKETPQLNAKVISPRDSNFDAPHQKLIVVDGLLAFKGSTNLTNAAMRKADTGLDVSELITDVQAIADFNNRFFAPVWKKIAEPSTKEVVMWDAPF